MGHDEDEGGAGWTGICMNTCKANLDRPLWSFQFPATLIQNFSVISADEKRSAWRERSISAINLDSILFMLDLARNTPWSVIVKIIYPFVWADASVFILIRVAKLWKKDGQLVVSSPETKADSWLGVVIVFVTNMVPFQNPNLCAWPSLWSEIIIIIIMWTAPSRVATSKQRQWAPRWLVSWPTPAPLSWRDCEKKRKSDKNAASLINFPVNLPLAMGGGLGWGTCRLLCHQLHPKKATLPCYAMTLSSQASSFTFTVTARAAAMTTIRSNNNKKDKAKTSFAFPFQISASFLHFSVSCWTGEQ